MPRTQALAFAIHARRPYVHRPSTFSQSILRSLNTPQQCTASPLVRSLRAFSNSNHKYEGRPRLPFGHERLPRDQAVRAYLRRYMASAPQKNFRNKLRWYSKIVAYLFSAVALSLVTYIGIEQTIMEQQYGTPVDFPFWARWELRVVKLLFAEGEKSGTRWQMVAKYLQRLIKRVESAQDIKIQEPQDGKGGKILVDGVGQIGYDITAKSPEWRQGYFEVLMAMAQTGEWADGQYKRKGTSVKSYLFAKENIRDPSNPRPVPLKWNKQGEHLKPLPTFSEVEPVWDEPDKIYMKILTTYGFDHRQRLDAALAYADYLDFKGLKETSSDVLDWALDIAQSGLRVGTGEVVDMSTGVIKTGQEFNVSSNLLRAATAMGVHNARSGNVKEALPIFLSVLRARKSLPPEPPSSIVRPPKLLTKAELESRRTSDVFSGYVDVIKSFFSETVKQLPSDGNERPYHSLKEACEEVGLMTYIGEILFATSEAEREKGLAWTRDSVDAAEAILWFMDERASSTEGRKRCQECLQTGLGNWQTMVRKMRRIAQEKEVNTKDESGWLHLSKSKDVKKANVEVERWEEEERQIELKLQKTTPLLDKIQRPPSKMFDMV